MSGTTGTPRTQSYLLTTEFQDGRAAGSITPQDMRDFIVTAVPTGMTITNGSSITMTTTILRINKGSGSATSVTLPVAPIVDTQTYIIKDQKGDAATNNITIAPSSGQIDGSASYVMNVNKQSVSLVFDGTNWSII
jgi:hypothetical protein